MKKLMKNEFYCSVFFRMRFHSSIYTLTYSAFKTLLEVIKLVWNNRPHKLARRFLFSQKKAVCSVLLYKSSSDLLSDVIKKWIVVKVKLILQRLIFNFDCTYIINAIEQITCLLSDYTDLI